MLFFWSDEDYKGAALICW